MYRTQMRNMPSNTPNPSMKLYHSGQGLQRSQQVLHPHKHYSELYPQEQVKVIPIQQQIKQLVIITISVARLLFYMSQQPSGQGSVSFAERVEQLLSFLMYDLYGPKILSLRAQVNFFKGTTFLWVWLLMHFFDNYSLPMRLYLLLHGSYGLCWVTKDFWFPDARFKRKGSMGSHVLLFILLALYWLIPLPLAAGYGVSNPSTARIAFLISLYLTGIVLMMGSDYQKTSTLRKRKGLISDGFFKYTRNPNYLGEILIYSSFVFCSGHVLGYLIFYVAGGLVFAINIYVKDECSYKKKEGWEEYSKRSYILLPKVFATFHLNCAFYGAAFIAVGYFVYLQKPETFLYPFNLMIDL